MQHADHPPSGRGPRMRLRHLAMFWAGWPDPQACSTTGTKA